MNKIVPCLWFDNQGEEAAKFYASIFKNAKIKGEDYYGESGAEVSGMPKGQVMTVDFELEGQSFLALNGGPAFKFNEAVSFIINCDDQAEVDYFWEKLTADGGQEVQCGWLKDKFGLSWQVVPTILNKLAGDPDKEKGERVMKAMLQMKKIVIADLENAYKGE